MEKGESWGSGRSWTSQFSETAKYGVSEIAVYEIVGWYSWKVPYKMTLPDKCVQVTSIHRIPAEYLLCGWHWVQHEENLNGKDKYKFSFTLLLVN